MRTNPELSKKALSKYMRSTDLEESYQLLKSLIPIKPYPTLEGFKTVSPSSPKKSPPRGQQTRRTSSTRAFSSRSIDRDLSTVCTNKVLRRMLLVPSSRPHA